MSARKKVPSVVCWLRLPLTLRSQVDEYAALRQLEFAPAVAELVELGLAALRQEPTHWDIHERIEARLSSLEATQS